MFVAKPKSKAEVLQINSSQIIVIQKVFHGKSAFFRAFLVRVLIILESHRKKSGQKTFPKYQFQII